jgi:hypothetical protein
MEGENLLQRRKRVNFDGEWEYECVVCEEWLDKEVFGGCSKDVDAYGNCLMCKTCRYKKANKKKMTTEQDAVRNLLEAIGFYDYPNAEEWYKAVRKKHGY